MTTVASDIAAISRFRFGKLLLNTCIPSLSCYQQVMLMDLFFRHPPFFAGYALFSGVPITL